MNIFAIESIINEQRTSIITFGVFLNSNKADIKSLTNDNLTNGHT